VNQGEKRVEIEANQYRYGDIRENIKADYDIKQYFTIVYTRQLFRVIRIIYLFV